MFKKLLGIMLAVILAVSPVATFATSSAGDTTVVVTENFNDGVITDDWKTSENGSATFSSGDYGYLNFNADYDTNATLTRELGIETAGAFTVDFRLKTDAPDGEVTVSVGGYNFTINPESQTAAFDSNTPDFVNKLWYDVRVASADGATVNVYLDAIEVATAVPITYKNEFSVVLSTQGMQVGIDDFVVYNENKGTTKMKTTPLDFKFDGFNFENDSTDVRAYNTSQKVTTEPMKLVKGSAWNGTNQWYSWNATAQGDNVVNAKKFNKVAALNTYEGKFGKDAPGDTSVYFNHGISDNKSFVESTLDFNIGRYGRLSGKGDKQVISFNMAFDKEIPDDLILRTYDIYSSSGFMATNGGYRSNDITGDGGWLVRIVGESMYVFSDTNYYPIKPALLPYQWNNIRIERTVGDATWGNYYSATDPNKTAMYISVYVNDIPVVENLAILASGYFIQNRNSSPSSANKGAFQGSHRLIFDYNWYDGYNVANGLYLDDIKVENYYSGATVEDVESPLLWDENGTLGIEETGSVDDINVWRNDKWVQGNVVYVDAEQTLREYKDTLRSDRNLGIIFRDASGNEIIELDSAIGDLKYAEITRTDYSKIYVSLIGESTKLDDLALDGSSAITSTWANGAVEKWDTEATITSENGDGGKDSTDMVLKIADGSAEKRTKFAFFSRNANPVNDESKVTPSVYKHADFYRPITIEMSVLMPDAGSKMNIGTWHMAGAAGSYVDEETTLTHGSIQNALVVFANGHITARNEYTEGGTSFDDLGEYNLGEWNKVSFTFYPGYPQYRTDICINGKVAIENVYVKANSVYQAILWLLFRTTGDVYIDDVTATTGYYDYTDDSSVITLPELNTAELSANGDSVVLKNDAVAAETLTSALAELGTIRVYTDKTYASINEGNLNENSVIVAENDKNVIEYFTVTNREIAVTEADGTYTATSFASDKDAVLIAAQYGANGLVKVNKSSNKPDANGKLSVDFRKDTSATEIKVFLLGSMKTITPEMAFKPVSVTAAE